MGGFADDYDSSSELHIDITVKKDKLMERLKENREQHRKVYKEALRGWQKDLVKALEEIDATTCQYWPDSLSELKRTRPVSHLDEYDRAIDMFQMCITEEIKLNSGIFRKLCRDEWDWKSSVLKNRYYLGALSSV